jgi:hypothetical protein
MRLSNLGKGVGGQSEHAMPPVGHATSAYKLKQRNRGPLKHAEVNCEGEVDDLAIQFLAWKVSRAWAVLTSLGIQERIC